MDRLFSVRGAVQVQADTQDQMQTAVVNLVQQLVSANGIETADIVHIIFSQTADLVQENPARALRTIGFDRVPLFCTQEPAYPDTLPRIVRVLLTYYQTADHDPSPAYLGGAERLRTDLFR